MHHKKHVIWGLSKSGFVFCESYIVLDIRVNLDT